MATALAASLNAGISPPSNSSLKNANASASQTQDVKALEQTRQRLLQLTSTLAALRRDIEINDPLPTWPNMQASFALLAHHLSTLATLVSTSGLSAAEEDDDGDGDNGDEDEAVSVLNTGHAYPLPSFPREQEGLLGQLLRKKLEIGVESWVSEGRTALAGNQEDVQAKEELWVWAARKARELGRTVPWNTDYTLEERERGVDSVKTGLRRKLTLGDDDDDDDDDQDEDGDNGKEEQQQQRDGTKATGPGAGAAAKTREVKMLSLEDVYRYQSTGASSSPGLQQRR